MGVYRCKTDNGISVATSESFLYPVSSHISYIYSFTVFYRVLVCVCVWGGTHMGVYRCKADNGISVATSESFLYPVSSHISYIYSFTVFYRVLVCVCGGGVTHMGVYRCKADNGISVATSESFLYPVSSHISYIYSFTVFYRVLVCVCVGGGLHTWGCIDVRLTMV